MTPEGREAIWGPRDVTPSRGPGLPRRHKAITPQGGIASGCGCRFVRTGGVWLHVTPCRDHLLLPHPINDEHMRGLISA